MLQHHRQGVEECSSPALHLIVFDLQLFYSLMQPQVLLHDTTLHCLTVILYDIANRNNNQIFLSLFALLPSERERQGEGEE